MSMDKPSFEMSPFTQSLFIYERDYLKKASQDKTIRGTVKSYVLGRIVTMAVSLILHAEAVCRAVYICFLAIKSVFSRCRVDVLRKEREACRIAYNLSMNSLGVSLFLTNLADPFYKPKTKSPALLPKSSTPFPSRPGSPISDPSNSIQKPIATSPPFQPIQTIESFSLNEEYLKYRSSSISTFEHLQSDKFSDLALESGRSHAPSHTSSAERLYQQAVEPILFEQAALSRANSEATRSEASLVSSNEELFKEAALNSPLGKAAIRRLSVASPSSDASWELSDFDEAALKKARDPIESNEREKAPEIDEHELHEIVILTEKLDQAAHSPQFDSDFNDCETQSVKSYDSAIFEEQLPPPLLEQSSIPSFISDPTIPKDEDLISEEEYRIKVAMEIQDKQNQILLEEMRVRNESEINVLLKEEEINASKQLDINSRVVPYKIGPEDQYHCSKWDIKSKNLGHTEKVLSKFEISAGICRYAEYSHLLKAQTLVSKFDIPIGQSNHPVFLFGIFDPLMGPRAALFLKQNLQAVLTSQLIEKNANGCSNAGIWNALSSTFLTLNQDFISAHKNKKVHPLLPETIADHGSTSTVAMIFEGSLWVANLGNSRAVLSSPGINWETPVQLSEDPDPSLPKYKKRIEELGGSVNGSLLNDKLTMATGIGSQHLNGLISSKPGIIQKPIEEIIPGSCLFLGNRPFFETASSRNIAKMLYEHRDLEAYKLAHDCSYSISQVNPDIESMACIVIKFEEGWESIGL